MTPTAGTRPPTADRRPPTADRRPPTADRRPPTADTHNPGPSPTLNPLDDITSYARLDVTRRGADSGQAWAMLVARILLGGLTAAAAAWKIFHVGPFASARVGFVAPLSKTFVPEWIRWLVGFPFPFVELLAGLMVLLGVQLRAALLMLAATLVVAALGAVARAPLGDLPVQLLPRLVLVLYLLATPAVLDEWSLDAWLERRRRLS